MNKSESIKELATALAKAQGEIENASKNAENPAFKRGNKVSTYADLAEVLNTVRPVLSKHGLSVSQFPSFESGVASVESIVMHSSGEWLSDKASAPVVNATAQGVGSVITYLRRYSLAAIAGIAQEDDDANSSIGSKHEKLVSIAQAIELRTMCEQAGIVVSEFCELSKIDAIDHLPSSRFDGAVKYLKGVIAKQPEMKNENT